MTEIHEDYCAFAGLPRSVHGSLPWPAPPGEEMCACPPVMDMTPAELDKIRHRVELAEWGADLDGRPTPDEVVLLAHVDHLTAKVEAVRSLLNWAVTSYDGKDAMYQSPSGEDTPVTVRAVRKALAEGEQS